MDGSPDNLEDITIVVTPNSIGRAGRVGAAWRGLGALVVVMLHGPFKIAETQRPGARLVNHIARE